MFKTRTHFEVEEFIDKIRAKNIKYGRATVYRTIKQLLDAGLIQKIQTRDGKVFYERTPDHQQHDHIICNDTGKIIEIKDERIEKLLNEICDEITKYYIPCKAKTYLKNIDINRSIVILRQFLKCYGYTLFSKEKFIKGEKHTIYKIVTIDKEINTPKRKEKIIVSFD